MSSNISDASTFNTKNIKDTKNKINKCGNGINKSERMKRRDQSYEDRIKLFIERITTSKFLRILPTIRLIDHCLVLDEAKFTEVFTRLAPKDCRFWSLILNGAIVENCSNAMIKWLLANGANPNQEDCKNCSGITLMGTAALHSNKCTNQEIFYWLIIHGGEIAINPDCANLTHDISRWLCNYVNIIHVIQSRDYIHELSVKRLSKKVGEEKKKLEMKIRRHRFINETPEDRENKQKVLEWCIKGINRMKKEIIDFSKCLIIVLHNIIFDYMLLNDIFE